MLGAETKGQSREALETLLRMDDIESAELFLSLNSEGRANGKLQTVNLVIPENPVGFSEYVMFEKTDGSGRVSMQDDSVLITEKLSIYITKFIL